MEADLERAEEELGDALTRQALLNDRSAQILADLHAARWAGSTQAVRSLATQLDVVEARRTRAMTIAQEASRRLSELRHRVVEG